MPNEHHVPLSPEYAFGRKNNRGFSLHNSLIMSLCTYADSSETNTLAFEFPDVAEITDTVIRINNGRGRRVFQWTKYNFDQTEATEKTMVVRVRLTGANRLRLNIAGLSEHHNVRCLGRSRLNMRFMPSGVDRSFVGFDGEESLGFELVSNRKVKNVNAYIKSQCEHNSIPGVTERLMIVGPSDLPEIELRTDGQPTYYSGTINSSETPFQFNVYFTRIGPNSIQADITVSSSANNLTCTGSASILTTSSG